MSSLRSAGKAMAGRTSGRSQDAAAAARHGGVALLGGFSPGCGHEAGVQPLGVPDSWAGSWRLAAGLVQKGRGAACSHAATAASSDTSSSTSTQCSPPVCSEQYLEPICILFLLPEPCYLLRRNLLQCIAQRNTAVAKGLPLSPLESVGVLLLISIGTRHFCALG